jgi:DNA-binding transcriptional regulator YiaG
MATQTTSKPRSKRRGPPPSEKLGRPDHPFTMKLRDGRTLFVEVPGRWMTTDRDGKPAFLPAAVEFLDRVQALATSALDRAPSPGYLTRLREGLGLTQKQFADRLGMDAMTVSRWERGTMRPSEAGVRAIEKLRKELIRRGVTIES